MGPQASSTGRLCQESSPGLASSSTRTTTSSAAAPSSRTTSTTRDRDSATGSSWTPVRSVLGEKLVRTPALEMEDLLWSAGLSLGDGLWSVSLGCASETPGVYARISHFRNWINAN